MSALMTQIPVATNRLGGLWIRGDALAAMLKAIKRVASSDQDTVFSKIIVRATTSPLVIVAHDGRRTVEIRSHQFQLEQQFSCVVQHEKLYEIATLIDGDVFRVELQAGGSGWDENARNAILELRDFSGVFKLWAMNGETPETHRGKGHSHRYLNETQRIAKAAKDRAADEKRTALVLADLARFDEGRSPLVTRADDGFTQYDGTDYTLRVAPYDS